MTNFYCFSPLPAALASLQQSLSTLEASSAPEKKKVKENLQADYDEFIETLKEA
jgi:hypothetical protein